MDYQDRYRVRSKITLAIFAAAVTIPVGGLASESAKFSLPLDCTGGTVCFLQNLVDLQPGPVKQDPFCGSATFNGHKGTDIRVRDIPAMNKGIPVLAMADGLVMATRDGEADRLVLTKADRKAVNKKECGNGIIIKHLMADGAVWTTQTCHLAKGSVSVRKGDRVKRGQAIGKMGLSGATQFPHVHVSFKMRKQIVDPITGIRSGGTCNSASSTNLKKSLFTETAIKKLQTMGTPVIHTGFASAPVQGVDLTKGTIRKATSQGPLVFYAKLINLKKGDQIRLTINGPTGMFAQNTTKPLDQSKATYTVYSGKKGTVAPGKYTGKVDLVRGGKVIFSGGAQSITF